MDTDPTDVGLESPADDSEGHGNEGAVSARRRLRGLLLAPVTKPADDDEEEKEDEEYRDEGKEDEDDDEEEDEGAVEPIDEKELEIDGFKSASCEQRSMPRGRPRKKPLRESPSDDESIVNSSVNSSEDSGSEKEHLEPLDDGTYVPFSSPSRPLFSPSSR